MISAKRIANNAIIIREEYDEYYCYILVSYDTVVMKYTKHRDNTEVIMSLGYISKTTQRHIKKFCNYFGLNYDEYKRLQSKQEETIYFKHNIYYSFQGIID